MSTHTHVIEYDGGEIVEEIGAGLDISVFANPLRRLNGRDHWALTLYALPADMTRDEMLTADWASTEYLWAGGTAEAMTVELCEPGSPLWAAMREATWLRSVIGRSQERNPALDVAIEHPEGTAMVSQSEVFGADEAAAMFQSYCNTGELPLKCSRRMVGMLGENDTRLSLPTLSNTDEISRKVYRGDIPGDLYYGRWPNRLIIFAAIGSEGFKLIGHDSVEWPDRDQHWTARVAPEQLPQLRAFLGATPEMTAAELLDLVAAWFGDGTISAKRPIEWLKDAGIEYRVTQQFLEN